MIGLIKFIGTFFGGTFTGIYIAQNYEVPKASDIINKYYPKVQDAIQSSDIKNDKDK